MNQFVLNLKDWIFRFGKIAIFGHYGVRAACSMFVPTSMYNISDSVPNVSTFQVRDLKTWVISAMMSGRIDASGSKSGSIKNSKY